jgi:uncharacterized protein YjiS (DUF1127 family)
MSQQGCTQTMRPRGPALALVVALGWFALRRLREGAGRSVAVGLVWLERARQRRRLGELNDYMLRDIGLTRADAWAESAKPFWRP